MKYPDMVSDQQMNKTGTVSYTHLRAHETVLDLVCRLLLEKKKTTKYYNSKLNKNHDTTLLPIYNKTIHKHYARQDIT